MSISSKTLVPVTQGENSCWYAPEYCHYFIVLLSTETGVGANLSLGQVSFVFAKNTLERKPSHKLLGELGC